jgi:hypothetical protein
VVIKGTTVGTTSDAEGNFTLNVPNDEAVLVFSFIGYRTQEVRVGTTTQFDIRLDPDVETLSEVVVVGYGETKKESLTSAITSVKGQELVKSRTYLILLRVESPVLLPVRRAANLVLTTQGS